MEQQSHQKRIISQQTVFETKWLGLEHITYKIGDKAIRNYESVYRPRTRKAGCGMDGVQVMPIIKTKGCAPEVVFIANFRPSAGRFCIEFPAGLLESTNYEQNGLRQLEEQTGYTAQKLLKIPNIPVHSDPWKSDETGFFFVAIIDGDDPNHKKKQDLEQEQNIRTFTLPLDSSISTALSQFANQHDYSIHSKVWTLTLGFSLSNWLPL